MFKTPEHYRLTTGKAATTKESYGNNGVFYIPIKKKIPGINRFILLGYFQCIASDGLGWEHVSVCVVSQSKKEFTKRMPTWEEMCTIKDTFWEKSDTCIQFHPDEKSYVNNHPYVLHIWKRIGSFYELPLKLMV